MGNCVAFHSQSKKQTRGPLIEGREIGVDVSVPLEEKMNLASSKRYILVPRKLQHGEVYHPAILLNQSGKPLVSCRTTDNRNLKTRIVKIVVTTEQLELLLSGSIKFQTKSRVARVRKSSRLQRCPKWFPSLPTIQEVQDF
ncbi:hypothetical protein SESBI_08752 [Sesbania bispinosa]|nr:hypothetical protein SESBI_08752 [Sesbania bispinosa]